MHTFPSCAPAQTPPESWWRFNKICGQTPDSAIQVPQIMLASLPALFLHFPAVCVWLAVQFSTAMSEVWLVLNCYSCHIWLIPSLQSLCLMHTGKPTGVAVSHCVNWFQTQLILIACQIHYHSPLLLEI